MVNSRILAMRILRLSLWRRVVLGLLLATAALVLVLTVAARTYSFVLTRKMGAVIAGLSKLDIDKTSEDELFRTVPYLLRSPWEEHLKRTVETGDIDTGVERFYSVVISNESSWMRFSRSIEPLLSCCAKTTYTKDGHIRNWVLSLADLLGYRYVYFSASVVVLNTKVSRIRYGISDRLVFPRQSGEIVSVTSAHSFWAPLRSGFEVQSTDDESPQFRVAGNEHGLGVFYAYDAPRDFTQHAFELDLRCFWALRGCSHVRKIAPKLWQDKENIEAATLARLQSPNPCPDRILGGRARYLPDVSIVLLESKGIRARSVLQPGWPVGGTVTDYKGIEAVRGTLPQGVQPVWSTDTVPFPGDYNRRLPNNGLKSARAGERVLGFLNLAFDTCGIVPATPSSLAAIENVAPAPRRWEDELVRGLM